MDAVRRLASLAHSARQQRKLAVRQPLARMRVAVPAAARGPALDSLLELLGSEVNVKAVRSWQSDTDLVRLRAKPNFRSLGKRYGKRTPAVAAAAAALSAEQLRGLETGTSAELSLDGERVTYLPEDVMVEREVVSDWLVRSDGPLRGGARPVTGRRAARGRLRPRDGQPDPASPEGRRVRVHRPDRALDRRRGAGARGGPWPHRVYPGRDARPPGGAGHARSGTGPGTGSGDRWTRGGGGSATSRGRPERGRPQTRVGQ